MNIGDVVTVQVRDPRNPKVYANGVVREWNQYTGTIVPNLKGFADDVFCMTTGNAAFPIRVIDKARCSVFKQSYLPAPAASSKRMFSVKSSKPGHTYTVTQDGSHWSCNCVGFGFRKDCKHIRECK
jgi:hypothetical protein